MYFEIRALLGFGDYSDELMAAAEAFPIGAEFVDEAAAEDEFSTFRGFACFHGGLSVDDSDHFAAAMGAFVGLAKNVGDVEGFLAHIAWFYKVIKKRKSSGKPTLNGNLATRNRHPDTRESARYTCRRNSS